MDLTRSHRPAGGRGTDVAPSEHEEDDSDAITVIVDPRMLGVLDLPEDAIEAVREPEVFSIDSRPARLPASPRPLSEAALLAAALAGAVLGCFAAVWWVLG